MQKLNAKQLGELEARQFLGDETWKRWKQDLDDCLAYRKTLKGKPTDEQRAQLDINNIFIEYYGSVLFHSPTLARRDQCPCTRCGQRRTTKNSVAA